MLSKKFWIIPLFMLLFSCGFTQAQQFTWKHTGGPYGGQVGDIAIDSAGNIYSGVYSTWIRYSGLFKSSDNGNTWKKMLNPLPGFDFDVYSIYITRKGHIFVGANWSGTIYRSTDDGVTWKNTRTGYSTGECWAFGETKNGTLVAGDGSQYHNLYRSTDNGENWQYITNLAPLAFATDSNDVIFCGAQDGLYKSTDTGLTWNKIDYFGYKAVSTVIIDSANTIYCGTGYYGNSGLGVHTSTDGGNSWNQIGLGSNIVYSLALDKYHNIYAGTERNGIFTSTNNGIDWEQHTEGIYKKEIFRLKLNKSGDIFAASEYEGVYRSTNQGNSFEQVGLPVSYVEMIELYKDSLIFAATPSGVQEYNRTSKKWKNIGLHYVNAVRIDQNNTLYAACGDNDCLYYSNDFGSTWLNYNLPAQGYQNVLVKDNYIFALGRENSFHSSDNGKSWKSFPYYTENGATTMHNNYFYFSAIGPYMKGNLYRANLQFTQIDSLVNILSDYSNGIVIHDSIILLTTNEVFRSTDYGGTWNKIANKFLRSFYYNIEEGIYFAGGYDSLYILYENGTRIVGIPEPFPKPWYDNFVTDIKRDFHRQYFFATRLQGMYEMDYISGINDQENFISDYSLSQNYPNPFNPETNINYSILKTEEVTIKIFNVLGALVETIHEGIKSPGSHTVRFNGSKYSSGVYFYQLISGDYLETKKMVLIR